MPGLARCCLLLAVLAGGCGGGSEPRVVSRAGPDSADRPNDAPAGTSSGPATATVGAGGTAGLLVDVAGHVRRPGVYRLQLGARVHEAIAAAGGSRPGADLGRINRAATLVDGQQVLVAALVPAGALPAPAKIAGASQSQADGPISINAADVAALDGLPGIGPVTAERIVADREKSGPFSSIDDLDRVSGIGPATVEALREVATP